MNSTWILKLYPDQWRARYEPEFRALLEEAPMGFMDLFDIAFGAIDAHIRPSTVGLVAEGNAQSPAPADPDAAARRQVRLLKYFWMHAGLSGLISVVLILINALTWNGMVWSAIVIWGMAIPLSIHAMVTFPWRGIFGALAIPLGVINLGLVGLNLWVNASSPWSLWTISASLVPVIGAGLVSFNITSPQRAFGISGVLVALLLVVASIFEPELLFHVVFELGIVAAVLYSWEQLRRGKWTLFAAHGFLFAAINVMALALNLVRDPEIFWFQYVLAASSLFLAVHAMVRFGLLESYDANWEDAKVARLTSRIRDSAVTDAVQRKIFLTARIQRSFWMHLCRFARSRDHQCSQRYRSTVARLAHRCLARCPRSTRRIRLWTESIILRQPDVLDRNLARSGRDRYLGTWRSLVVLAGCRLRHSDRSPFWMGRHPTSLVWCRTWRRTLDDPLFGYDRSCHWWIGLVVLADNRDRCRDRARYSVRVQRATADLAMGIAQGRLDLPEVNRATIQENR